MAQLTDGIAYFLYITAKHLTSKVYITVFEIQSDYLRHVRQTLAQLDMKNYKTNKCVGVR